MASGIPAPNREETESEPLIIQVMVDDFKIIKQQDLTSACVFRVSKTLKRKEDDEAYVPQVVTLGPYHFQDSISLGNHEIESLKTEVASKMYHRMGDSNFRSMVRMILHKDQEIRDCYGEQLRWDPQALVSIMVTDACFVLEVLIQLVGMREDEDWPGIDTILNRKYYHPFFNEIVKDMLKIENQLPLYLLREVLEKSQGLTEEHKNMYGDYFESALLKLYPFVAMGFRWTYRPLDLGDKRHILELLHSYIVGEWDGDCIRIHRRIASLWKYLLLPILFFPCFMTRMMWRSYVKSLYIKQDAKDKGENNSRSASDWINLLLLIPFYLCLIPRMLWRSYVKFVNKEDVGKTDRENFRSVTNLKSVGIKFRNCNGGIRAIHFDIYNFILYLPHLRIDDRSEVLLRNLIAFEISSSMGDKPVTRYVHFMSNLLSTRKDVTILKNEGIITNKLGSDEEASQLLNLITKSLPSSTFSPLDYAERQLNIHCKIKLQVLWAQFWTIDCSHPWLVVSFVGAALLLLMTAVQVMCLFYSCNDK
eukprot:Gb_37289 [translate_table: standard]